MMCMYIYLFFVSLSLFGFAQLAPAPSEKTITGAASSRHALEVD